MTRLAALAVAAVLAAAACGGESTGSGSATDALAETAANLGEIRSAALVLDLRASSEGDEAGFRLEGPFAFAESEDALPVAELEYTRIAGDEEASVTFVSTGDRAWVVANGEAQELSEERLEGIRGSGAGSGGGSGGGDAALGTLEIGDWFVEPELSDGGEVGGAETDKIASELDVVAAVQDLVELAGGFGLGGPALDERNAEQLERAVESSQIEVFTGKEDRLLRRMVAEVQFEAEPPPELEDVYSGLPGAAFELELALSDPNGEITVEPPAGT